VQWKILQESVILLLLFVWQALPVLLLIFVGILLDILLRWLRDRVNRATQWQALC
jgi:predicted PurR-regulated permease PerM